VLTIFYVSFFCFLASYISDKNSDFGYFEKIKFFRFWQGTNQGIQIARVSKDDTIIPMGILDNFEEYIDLGKLNSESAWDEEFQFESSGLKFYSDTCCNGCTCQTSDAHKPEN
jgi:hypothetical protein